MILYTYRIQIQSIWAKVGSIRPLDASPKDFYPLKKRLVRKRGKNAFPNVRRNIKTFLLTVGKLQQQNIVAFRFHRFYTRVHFLYFNTLSIQP